MSGPFVTDLFVWHCTRCGKSLEADSPWYVLDCAACQSLVNHQATPAYSIPTFATASPPAPIVSALSLGSSVHAPTDHDATCVRTEAEAIRLLNEQIVVLRRERDERQATLDAEIISARADRERGLQWKARAEHAEAAARFGAKVLAAHREHMGDVDGSDLQDWAVEAGLLEQRVVTETCGDDCICKPGDACYFLTEAGTAATSGVAP